jgi:hypothetical protein
MADEVPPYDSVVTAVIQKFQQRARFGKAKYGTDLDRKDLKVHDWITHAQEELMDGILYLEKLKQEIPKPSAYPPPKTVKCYSCHGTGKDITHPEWTCGSCHGDCYE